MLSRLLSATAAKRHFATTANYESTLRNLLVNKNTKVICQGITDQQGAFHSKEAIDFGTHMVGGVSPKKAGATHLGLPIFGTVQQAVAATKPDASVIFAPPSSAADAILEAIEAEVGLIVAITEGVPLHDMVKIKQALVTQNKSRLVGPNSHGLICAGQQCKIGTLPASIISNSTKSRLGNIAVVSRSGTLTYEAMQQIADMGFGHSLCIDIGSDPINGTSFIDILQVVLDDKATDGVVLIGQVGGSAEEDAAMFLKEYNRQQKWKPKPVVSFIAGMTGASPFGHYMGTTAATALGGKGGALEKIKALERAGIVVTSSPSKIGATMYQTMKDQGFIWA